MKMKRTVALALTVCMLAVPTLQVRAESQDIVVEELQDSVAAKLEKNMVNGIQAVDSQEKIEISGDVKSRGTSMMPDNPVGVLPGVLTAEDNMEMHFFSVTQNALLLLGITSENANYYVQLYMVDYNTGNVTPTNVLVSAGNATAINGVPAGDYVFVVASADGSVGQEYSMMVNAQNQAGSVQLKYVGPTLENTMVLYSNGDVYANGKFALNYTNPDLQNLAWDRQYYLGFPGGGYQSRTHSISDVKVKSIDLQAITYSSSYASSSFAIRINLAPDTLYTYRYNYYPNGGPMDRDEFDPTGQRTPRRLTADDTVTGDCILIFGLNDMKPIDLYSGRLNFYYHNGIESAQMFTKVD